MVTVTWVNVKGHWDQGQRSQVGGGQVGSHQRKVASFCACNLNFMAFRGSRKCRKSQTLCYIITPLFCQKVETVGNSGRPLTFLYSYL